MDASESKTWPVTRVMLWTAPRCLSSAFERSVRELQDVKVLYEPHLLAYYCGPERKTEQQSALVRKYSKYTYDHVDDSLLAEYRNYEAVFAKNMAFYIPKERYGKYIEGDFSTYQHTFLIRDPNSAILSQWRVCQKHGFNFPGSEVDSFLRLHELFEYVRGMVKDVIVLDASDLVENPESVMENYCKSTSLPYKKEMLTWTPGVVEDWTVNAYYKEWHGTVMSSAGFNVGVRKPDTVQESVPTEVMDEIRKAMPCYKQMLKYKMNL